MLGAGEGVSGWEGGFLNLLMAYSLAHPLKATVGVTLMEAIWSHSIDDVLLSPAISW